MLDPKCVGMPIPNSEIPSHSVLVNRIQQIVHDRPFWVELAREDLSVLIAQMTEGRTPLSRVEQARVAENERWIQLYAAEIQLQRARLAVLRDTGTLVATLRAVS